MDTVLYILKCEIQTPEITYTLRLIYFFKIFMLTMYLLLSDEIKSTKGCSLIHEISK